MRIVSPVGAGASEVCADIASVGDSPRPDPKEPTFLAVDPRTPYTTDFDGADAGFGSPLHAALGEHDRRKGTVGETASATIGA